MKNMKLASSITTSLENTVQQIRIHTGELLDAMIEEYKIASNWKYPPKYPLDARLEDINIAANEKISKETSKLEKQFYDLILVAINIMEMEAEEESGISIFSGKFKFSSLGIDFRRLLNLNSTQPFLLLK